MTTNRRVRPIHLSSAFSAAAAAATVSDAAVAEAGEKRNAWTRESGMMLIVAK